MTSYEPGGEGATSAAAVLAHLFYARSHTAATAAIDNQVDPQDRFSGIKGHQYSETTFKRTVGAAGYFMDELDLKKCSINSAFNSDGVYIVAGVTNNKWCLKNLRSGNPRPWADPNLLKYNGKKGDDVAPGIDDSTQPSFGSGADTGWHHLIAISNGNLLDFDSMYSVREAMWLGEDNQPDPNRSYMRTIRKVWRITKKPAAADRKRGRSSDCDTFGHLL